MTAGLFVGTSAWADTETTTLLSVASYTHAHDAGDGARSAYYDFGVNSSIDDNWTASFDVTTTTSNTAYTKASNYQIAITSADASYTANTLLSSNVLLGASFATTQTNLTSLACTITLNDVAEAETVTLTHGTTYTFTVAVDGTSLTASIKNGSTTVYSGSTTLAAFVKPRGIWDLLPRPYASSMGIYTNPRRSSLRSLPY